MENAISVSLRSTSNINIKILLEKCFFFFFFKINLSLTRFSSSANALFELYIIEISQVKILMANVDVLRVLGRK